MNNVRRAESKKDYKTGKGKNGKIQSNKAGSNKIGGNNSHKPKVANDKFNKATPKVTA